MLYSMRPPRCIGLSFCSQAIPEITLRTEQAKSQTCGSSMCGSRSYWVTNTAKPSYAARRPTAQVHMVPLWNNFGHIFSMRYRSCLTSYFVIRTQSWLTTHVNSCLLNRIIQDSRPTFHKYVPAKKGPVGG